MSTVKPIPVNLPFETVPPVQERSLVMSGSSDNPSTDEGSKANEPRPIKATEEARRRVATELIKEIEPDARHVKNMIEDLVKEITDRHRDGYELAKHLDSHCGWDCDFRTAEILDNFSHMIGREIDLAQKEWVERNNIQPPLSTGTRVSIKSWRETETGTIDGIDQYGPARFLVKIDGQDEADKSRRIVNFEDAIPLSEGA